MMAQAEVQLDHRQADGRRTATATLVSVVIPCFNEAQGLPTLHDRLRDFLAIDQTDYEFEFLLVDDGSGDDTFEIMQKLFGKNRRFRILKHRENLGLSAAILTGFKAAAGDWIVSLDSDCTYDPRQIFDLLHEVQRHPKTSMVVGSPYHPQGRVLQVPHWRIFISKTANRIYRLLMRTKLNCYTGCFRAVHRSYAQQITLTQPGFVGMTEMVWRVEQLGGLTTEVPAVLDVRRYGQSKLRLLRVVRQHLWFMTRLAAGLERRPRSR